jgi:hypothetical protein
MTRAPYVNPLEHAHVTPERIDMGVDYAGTGSYVAIGKAVITQINPGGWGSYGNFIEYKLLSGPDAGRTVYYAEGVNPVPGLKVGQIVPAGAPVANLIPGWHSGTEIGWGGAPSASDTTYAQSLGGGYTEGQRTAAGQAFSNFIAGLGAPPGLAEGRPITGTYQGTVPSGGSTAGQAGSTVSATGQPTQQGGILSSIPGASWIGDVANFISNPMHVLLTIALVIGGAFVFYKGVGRTLGADQQPKKTRVVPVPV